MPTPKQFSITGPIQKIVEWIRNNRATRSGTFTIPEVADALNLATPDTREQTDRKRTGKQKFEITCAENPYKSNGKPTNMNRTPNEKKQPYDDRDERIEL